MIFYLIERMPLAAVIKSNFSRFSHRLRDMASFSLKMHILLTPAHLTPNLKMFFLY